MPHVPGREHAGDARLEQQRRPFERSADRELAGRRRSRPVRINPSSSRPMLARNQPIRFSAQIITNSLWGVRSLHAL
ncbi:MAG TPA: hypothetical protein VGM53_33025 [Streptosporangiaceae bacterium]